MLDPPGQHHSTVIWLHGLGADAYDFVNLPEALRLPPGQGVRFIFPNAPMRAVSVNGNMRMRAWFDISSQDLTMVADGQHLDQISLLLEALVAEQGDRPVVLAGFSQGGATALFTGMRRSVDLAGILSVAGWLPTEAADDAVPGAPVLLLHGDSDDVVPLSSARESYSRLLRAEPPAVLKTYGGTGHTMAPESVNDVREWLLAVLPAVGTA